jgi:hypothetical protein
MVQKFSTFCRQKIFFLIKCQIFKKASKSIAVINANFYYIATKLDELKGNQQDLPK